MTLSGPNERRSDWLVALSLLAFFVALDLATVPGLIGDTLVYADDILTYSRTADPARTRLLWEFGHLLWRPLGYFLWRVNLPALTSLFAGNPIIEVTGVLFGICWICGAASTVLIFVISRRMGLSQILAALVTIGMLLDNAFLNWLHSGSSYVPGFSLDLLGFWLILKAIDQAQRRLLYSIAAGAALALACGFWFTYVLSIPAALLLGLLAPPSLDSKVMPSIGERIRIVTFAAIAAAAFAGFLFLGGAAISHLSTVAELKEWESASSHGLKVEHAFVRFPTGITRTFLFMSDDDGIILKRFVFGDPYAPVRWFDLAGSGLWKIGLVFLTFCVVFGTLLRTGNGRKALAVVLGGMLPTFAFALLLFETSSSERYFPLYASLIIGICAVLRRKNARYAHITLAVFLIAMAMINLKAFAWDLRAYAKTSSDRFQLVHDHTRHGGTALILSFKDPLSTYFQRSPFDPENQPGALPLYHVVEIESGTGGMWPSRSSCRMLQAWDAGGEVWLSKRLIATRPLPEWQWSENEVHFVRWADIYQFFTRFETNGDIGGQDGFIRVEKNEHNQATLQNNCTPAAH